MTTVVAAGQFGPNTFTVLSVKGTVANAKYLTDSVGANYIIDPNTGKPYIVPRDYDPGATAAYFTNKLNIAIAVDNALNLGVSSVTSAIYPELRDAFTQGGWGDIQRPFADKTNVVPDFIAAASFNLGVAAAAGGITAAEAIFFGGAYNVRTNGFWNLVKNPLEFGNNPGNANHIKDGSDQQDQGRFGIHDAQNSTSPDGLQTATKIDSNGDGLTDVILTTTQSTDNSYIENAVYLTSSGAKRGETVTAVNAGGTQATIEVDTNGDGRWETETIALADGSVEQNTAINDDGTSTKTVFDTGTEPWSSEASAFDAYQRLQSQRVVLDGGGQQIKQYDPNNTHPYDEVDIDEDATGKPTNVQTKFGGQPNNADFSAVGQVLGSALGRALAPNNQFVQLAAGTVVGAVGQKLAQAFAASLVTNGADFNFASVFSDFNVSIAGAGASSVASFLVAEIGTALHLDGFGAQLFNAGAGGFAGSVASQIAIRMAQGASFDLAIGAVNFANAAASAAYGISSLLGSYLGHELVPAQTHEGAVGGQLLGAIGSAIGISAALSGVLGTVLGFIVPGLGSLVGTVLGTLIGDHFGNVPHPAAIDLVDQAGYFYGYGHYQVAEGGNYDSPDQMAVATDAIINGYLAAVNGAALDHSKQTMVGYVTDPQLYYVSDWVPDHTNRNFLTPDDAVHAAALDILQHTEVIGGDLLLKRAHQNSNRQYRNRDATTRRHIRAGGWRSATRATAGIACIDRRFA